MKVVGAIGKHGDVVMVGQGANFIIPTDNRLSIRVVAPRGLRIRNVSEAFEISADVAERRIMRTEANRRAFVRKYFYADIAEALNYGLIINTGSMSIDTAVCTICAAYEQRGCEQG